MSLFHRNVVGPLMGVTALLMLGMQPEHRPQCSRPCVDIQFLPPVFDNPATPACTPTATATWCPVDRWLPPGDLCPDSWQILPTHFPCMESNDIRPAGNYPGSDCPWEIEFPPGSGIKYHKLREETGCCLFRENSLRKSQDPLSPGTNAIAPDGIGTCNEVACDPCEQ